MPVGAIVGSAVIGGAGAYFGGQAQKKGAEAAAAEMRAAREQMTPYVNFGKSAIGSLAQLFGLDPGGGGYTAGGPTFDTRAFENYPGYTFTRDQALRSLELSNAAKGLLNSGANLRGLQDTAAGLASGTIGQYISQLLGMGQLGAGAGATNVQGAAATGQFLNAAGQGQANSITGTANVLGSALGQYAGLSNLYGGANNLWNSSYLNPYATNAGGGALTYATPGGNAYAGTWMPAPRAATGGRFGAGQDVIVGDSPVKQYMNDEDNTWFMRMLRDRFADLDRRADADREEFAPRRDSFEDRWPADDAFMPHYADGGPVPTNTTGVVGDTPRPPEWPGLGGFNSQGWGHLFGGGDITANAATGGQGGQPSGFEQLPGFLRNLFQGGQLNIGQLQPYVDLMGQVFPGLQGQFDKAQGFFQDHGLGSQQGGTTTTPATPATPTAPVSNSPYSSGTGNLNINALQNDFGTNWQSSYQGGYAEGGHLRRGSATVGETRPEIFLPDDPNAPPEIIGQDGPEVRQFNQPGTVLPHEAFDPRVQDVMSDPFERAAARVRGKYPNVGSTDSPLEHLAGGMNRLSLVDTYEKGFIDPLRDPPQFGEIRQQDIDRALAAASFGTGAPSLGPATPGIQMGAGMFRRLFGKGPEPITPEARNLLKANNMIDAMVLNRGEMAGRDMSVARRYMNEVINEAPSWARDDPAQMLLRNPRLMRTIEGFFNRDEVRKFRQLERNAPPIREPTMSQAERREPGPMPDELGRIEPKFDMPRVRESTPEVKDQPRGALDYWAEPSGQSAPYERPAPLGAEERPPTVVRRKPAQKRVTRDEGPPRTLREVMEGRDLPESDLPQVSTPNAPPYPGSDLPPRLQMNKAAVEAGILRPGPMGTARRARRDLPPLGPAAPMTGPQPFSSLPSGTLSPEELMWLKASRGYQEGGRPGYGPAMVGEVDRRWPTREEQFVDWPRRRSGADEVDDYISRMSPRQLRDLMSTGPFAFMPRFADGGRPMPGQPGMVGDLPVAPGMGMIAGRMAPGNELPLLAASAGGQPPDVTAQLGQMAGAPTAPQPTQMGMPQMPRMPIAEPEKTFNLLLDYSRRLESLNKVGR